MDPKSLKRIERMNYLIGGVGAALCALFLPKEQALGVVVGVAIGSINFSMIRRIVTRWLDQVGGAEKNNGGGAGYFMAPKMGLLIAAVFLALRFLPIDPVFLAIGFSVFLVSIVIETARSLAAPPIESSDEDAA